MTKARQKRDEFQRRLAHLLDGHLADRRRHEQRHTKRRSEEADFAQHDEENAELNGIDAELDDDRKEDGRQQNDQAENSPNMPHRTMKAEKSISIRIGS